MNWEIIIEKKQLLINLSGSIYVEESAQLREKLNDYIDQGHIMLSIDFGDVDYIDSAGLGTLVVIQKRVLQKGGNVTVRGLKGMVRELFELTRLVKVFEIR